MEDFENVAINQGTKKIVSGLFSCMGKKESSSKIAAPAARTRRGGSNNSVEPEDIGDKIMHAGVEAVGEKAGLNKDQI